MANDRGPGAWLLLCVAEALRALHLVRMTSRSLSFCRDETSIKVRYRRMVDGRPEEGDRRITGPPSVQRRPHGVTSVDLPPGQAGYCACLFTHAT